MGLGQGASLNGFVPFSAKARGIKIFRQQPLIRIPPASSISLAAAFRCIPISAPVSTRESIGIPYIVVGASQPVIGVNFTAYGDESDPGPMPIPSDAPIEGYPESQRRSACAGARQQQLLALRTLQRHRPPATEWNAGSAAVWDLTANEQRP